MKDYKWLIIGTFAIVGVSAFMLLRSKAKIISSVQNARKFLEIQKQHGSFSNYIWNYVDHQPILNNWNTSEEVPSRTDLSDTICTDMKNRGFSFITPV
jgi:DNA-3-methyladenine glycosylase I